MSLPRTLAKLREDLQARAAYMVAQRPAGAVYPSAGALAETAVDQLVQAYGEAELAQWSTAELWSTAYSLLHTAALEAGFRRLPHRHPTAPAEAPPDAPATAPGQDAEPAVATIGAAKPDAGTPADGTAHPSNDRGASDATFMDGHWRMAHVQICLDGLPLNERRFLQVLLESDSAPMAQRAAHWPTGDTGALLTAVRQLLAQARGTIEGREAAMREEGLT